MFEQPSLLDVIICRSYDKQRHARACADGGNVTRFHGVPVVLGPAKKPRGRQRGSGGGGSGKGSLPLKRLRKAA